MARTPWLPTCCCLAFFTRLHKVFSSDLLRVQSSGQKRHQEASTHRRSSASAPAVQKDATSPADQTNVSYGAIRNNVQTKPKAKHCEISKVMLMPIYELITTTTDSSEKTSSTAACLTEQILHHMTHVDAETCNKCGCCTKWRNKFFKWGWSWNDNT